MTRLALILLIGLAGCDRGRGAQRGGGVAAPPNVAAPAPAAAPAPCADFATVTGRSLDQAERLDLDTDGTLDAAVREAGCGLRCDVKLYAARPNNCWVSVGHVRDVMSGPHCMDKPAAGSWCELSAMRLMIHGDAQEYTFSHQGTAYDPDGVHGARYVPARPKPPRKTR